MCFLVVIDKVDNVDLLVEAISKTELLDFMYCFDYENIYFNGLNNIILRFECGCSSRYNIHKHFKDVMAYLLWVNAQLVIHTKNINPYMGKTTCDVDELKLRLNQTITR